MIPKVIHYCWFGRNPKSASIEKCINSWKAYCPDYEIIEWNEDNFDIDCIPFVREAYDAGKWAFVTDYVRLRVIYEQGGIYLDTDVELLKSLDSLLMYKGYAGFQDDGCINTGLGFGAEKGNKMIYEMMVDYHSRHFPSDEKECKRLACPIINSKVLEKYGLIPNGDKQEIEGLTLFPSEYFSPKDSQTYLLDITDNTYSIHHFDATWRSKNQHIKQNIIRFLASIIGRKNFLKLKHKLKM